jgi:hypothetical protein
VRLQSLSGRSEPPNLAPEVGFGAVFPCISPELSSLHPSNQANSVTTSTNSFTNFLLAILLAAKVVMKRFEPRRLRGKPQASVLRN